MTMSIIKRCVEIPIGPGREEELEILVNIDNISHTFTYNIFVGISRTRDSIKHCFFLMALREILMEILKNIKGGKDRVLCSLSAIGLSLMAHIQFTLGSTC